MNPTLGRLLGSQESAIVVCQAFLEAAMAMGDTGAVMVARRAAPQPVNSEGLLS